MSASGRTGPAPDRSPPIGAFPPGEFDHEMPDLRARAEIETVTDCQRVAVAIVGYASEKSKQRRATRHRWRRCATGISLTPTGLAGHLRWRLTVSIRQPLASSSAAQGVRKQALSRRRTAVIRIRWLLWLLQWHGCPTGLRHGTRGVGRVSLPHAPPRWPDHPLECAAERGERPVVNRYATDSIASRSRAIHCAASRILSSVR